MKLKLNLQRRIQIQEVNNRKSKRNLKAKKATEKKEVELEKDLKGAKDAIEKKETRIQEVINANKKLNKQIIEAAKAKSETSLQSTSLQASSSSITSSSKSSDSFLTTSSTSNTGNSKPSDTSISSTSGIHYASHSNMNSHGPSRNKPPETNSKHTQTESHPDIPYIITSPLPPIFNSHLCHQSKRLHLSNSLPNLHTIGWITVVPEDKIRDEAEQALSDQYDRQVRDFYDEAKDQAKALREVYSENLISKLFEEK